MIFIKNINLEYNYPFKFYFHSYCKSYITEDIEEHNKLSEIQNNFTIILYLQATNQCKNKLIKINSK